MNDEYFESDADIASYLNMTLPAFLKIKHNGRFAVSPRPRDATPVYWVQDVQDWLDSGQPCSILNRGGS